MIVKKNLDLNTSSDASALESSLMKSESINEPNELENGMSSTTEEEYTPKLFSESNQFSEESHKENNEEEQSLFDQDNNEEEDFSIPAFLRRQKF